MSLLKRLRSFVGDGRRPATWRLRLLHSAVLVLIAGAPVSAQQQAIHLAGGIPRAELTATPVCAVDESRSMSLAITLPLRNQIGLDTLLKHLYDPSSPQFHKYLKPRQFADQFGPTQANYLRVIAFAQSAGLTVKQIYSNRTVLDVAGPASTVESAFGVHLLQFQGADGRMFYGPDRNPSIPSDLYGVVAGVIGLDNAAIARSHCRQTTGDAVDVNPWEVGTGPKGGLSPSDTKTAYDLSSISENHITVDGTGQTIALFELGTYAPSDVTSFDKEFGLPSSPSITAVGVDGFDTGQTPGFGQAEVTLDIDCASSFAPNANIIVYEGDVNGGYPTYIDIYAKIATDDLASVVSTSWGLDEGAVGLQSQEGEETEFLQMAAQGQSMFAAAGDDGAYDNGSTLSVDDPGSDPYVVCVGGTDLTTNGAGGAYVSETSWGDPSDTSQSPFGSGGGGGISQTWALPSWQIAAKIPTGGSLAASTMRHVPDVSLYADYDTGGYAIDVNGTWGVYGGTSAVSPLWASLTALVNQGRALNGSSNIGYPNLAIYPLASSARYGADFHDIADNSTNLYYQAVPGYDMSTGWGSPIGAALFADLAADVQIPTGLKALAGQEGINLTWDAVPSATSYNLYRSTSSGNETSTPYKTHITLASTADVDPKSGNVDYYTVAAVNSAGASQQSSEVSATPIPPAPTGLAAASMTSGAVLVWLSTPTATSYYVYRSTISGRESATPVNPKPIIGAASFTDTGLTNGVTYYYKVEAVNAAGTGPASSELGPVVPRQAAASFVRVDAVTRGSWKGVYGGDAQNIIGDSTQAAQTNLPYGKVLAGDSMIIWTSASTAAYALLASKARSYNRVVGAWYGSQSLSLNLEFTDNHLHQVALYLLDWDNKGRTESITLTDPSNKSILSSQTASKFAGGVYYVWDIQGHVIVKVSSTNATSPVVSALFFGLKSGQTAPAMPGAPSAISTSNQIDLTWSASTGATSYNIYRSTSPAAEGATPYKAGTTALAYKDTSVTQGTTYYYQVMAVNAIGGSPASAEAGPIIPRRAAATLVKTDIITQGSWKGVYVYGGVGLTFVDDDTQTSAPTLKRTAY